MQYDTTDFVETNGEATMKLIARTRRLTREYWTMKTRNGDGLSWRSCWAKSVKM